MVTALACAALSAALVCAPRPRPRVRFAGLWPMPRSPRRLPWRTAPVLVGVLLGLLVGGPGGALAGALVAVVVRRRGARQRCAAAADAAVGELAEAVARITEELRTGSHPAAALAGWQADGPRAREVLGPAAAAGRLGDDVAAALGRSAAQHPEIGADVERVAQAWSLAERHGIPLVELLGSIRDGMRWRARFGGAVRAELAGPRATATVLTGLPLLGLGLGQLIGADPIGVLRSGLLGQALLVAGVGLAAAGMAWSEHILRTAVPR